MEIMTGSNMRQQILCGLFFLICLSFHYVSSQCTLPTNDELVYLEYNNSSETFQPRKKAPFNSSSKFDDCDVTLQHNCCVCDDGEYYICLSLSSAIEYFLNAKQNNSNISQLYISIGQEEHNMIYTLDNIYKLNGFESFVLQGFGNSTIMCSNRSGLQINHSCETHIESLTFTNCRPISSRHYGAMVLVNNNNLYVSSVTFSNNEGTALYINFNRHNPNCPYKYYNITKSIFINNGIGTFKNLGGGIYMSIGEDVFASQITIKETHFYNNKADIGGGMYYNKNIKKSNEQCSSKMYMLDCVFFNNSATDHGGAMYHSGFSSVFEQVSFTENIAGYTGGAVYQYLKTPERPISTCQGVLYKNCNWRNNKAEGSSVLLVLAPSGILSNFHNDIIHLENNTIEKNNVTQIFFFGQTGCAIHIQNVPLHLTNVAIIDNYGTGLCLESTYVTFSSTNIFLQNQAFLGGAIYIQHSYLIFEDNADVMFYNNVAAYGGSIYQNTLANELTCLFQFQNSSNSSATTASVTFANNSAFSSGNSFYFLDPGHSCMSEVNRSEVHLIPNNNHQLSSEAYSIEFHTPVLNQNNKYIMPIILGQKLILNVTILDYFNQTSYAQITLLLLPPGDQGHIVVNPHYVLNGFRQFSISTGVNYPNLFIMGPKVNSTEGRNYILEVVGVHVTKVIELVLKDCPLGFLYNTSEQSCLCVSDDKVKCDFNSAQACIKKGYWLGEVDNVHTTAPCSSGYCQNTNDNCDLCPMADISNFCLLANTTNGQCVGNRRGVLCAECEVGYAFTFGTIQCVEDKTCSKGQGVVPPLLNVVFLIVTMTAIILLLKFDYKLSSGYIFCFVYYFSIVGHLLPSNVVGITLLGFVSIFESVTQLNPQFLGFVPICFSKNLTALQQQVFLYFNPFIISIFVLAVIGFFKYCSKCSKYITFKDNTLIKAICLLLLLSFTALTETSFNILNPVAFEGIASKFYVNIQPSTEYFNAKDHLPWFIIAILVEFLLVIPFTVLLLIAPLLTRCCNLNKIKPFLDEFQGCYKDNFRWMAGFYFLCRFMYLLILTYPSPNYVLLQYIIQLLSFSILVIHMLLQPYQNKWLNLSDSILLANITLITLLFGETAGVVFGSVPVLRQIIVYFLIFVPVFCLIIVVVVTAGKRCINKNSNRSRKSSKMNDNLKEPLITHTDVSPGGRSLSVSVGLREPMLALLESEEVELSDTSEGAEPSHRVVSYSIIESPRLRNFESGSLLRSRTITANSQDVQYEETNEEGDDL